MINIGKKDGIILQDGWTSVTRDKSLSAQFEHSLAVTKDGYEVFTYSPKGLDRPPYKLDYFCLSGLMAENVTNDDR